MKNDTTWRTQAAASLLVTLFLCLAASCSSTHRIYRDPNMDLGAIYTVAILPFSNLSKEPLAADRVRDVFMTMLLADGRVYVVPPGEVAKQIGTVGVVDAHEPTKDEVLRLGKALKVEGIITGVIREYGEVRSGSASANVIALGVQLTETDTGKVVSSVATTKGGIGVLERFFGGGGAPMNDITEEAIKDVVKALIE